MKTSDRYLLHSLDAVTPGGLSDARRLRRATVWTLFIAATHVVAFVAGFIVGRV